MTASFKVAEPPGPSQFNASFPITRPTYFFGKVKKKEKIPESLVKKQALKLTSTRSYLINTNGLKLSAILRFCSLFRHLIVLVMYIFYHLIISCRLNVRFNTQSCVHSFFFPWPTDPPSWEGGRWETKHFFGMALLKWRSIHYPLEKCNFFDFLKSMF